MTKQEVAQLLGVSEKTVGNYAKAGKLTVTYEPGKTSPVAVYDRAQVEALKEGQNVVIDAAVEVVRENLEQRKQEVGKREIPGSSLAKVERNYPVQSSQVPTSHFIDVSLLPELARALVQEVGQGSALQELAVKLNLTIKEASLYSGRPEKAIRDAIKNGELQSVKLLRGAGGVKRSELEKWNG